MTVKVLLVSENRCRDNLIPFPLGIAAVAAAVREAGHEVRGLDLMFSQDPAGDARRSVVEFQPDCVGLSIRNIDNQDRYAGEFYLPQVGEVAEALNESTDAPIILGGAGFTIFPLECLDYLDLELGIAGEGEGSFCLLLERLADGGDISEVPGIAMRNGGKRLLNPPGLAPDLDALAPPDRVVFDVSKYNWSPGAGGPPFTANIQARRGCHMRCIYCSSPLVEGRAMRLRDPASVADELEALEGLGIRTVLFTDSLFNHPPEYAKKLCAEVASRDLSLEWSANCNPSFYDPGLFELMRSAGCTTVSLGNESGSDDVLAALRKGFTRSDIARTVDAIRSAGLDFYCFLLLGGPGETRESVEESVAFMDELGPGAVRITVGIRIYPGCELYDTALKEGVIEPDQNLLFPTFYLSPEVGPWLYEHMHAVCEERPGWGL